MGVAQLAAAWFYIKPRLGAHDRRNGHHADGVGGRPPNNRHDRRVAPPRDRSQGHGHGLAHDQRNDGAACIDLGLSRTPR